ncbi:dolichyl-phosphate-mannose--protein mannosyltransferase [Leptospira sp. 96542]|nr:dolichyl-phosphate-mannose--protein mannosyltransferase [Leptospira sp. 96542]
MKLLFLSFPYLLCLVHIFFFPNVWYFPQNKIWLLGATNIFFALQLIVYLNKKFNWVSYQNFSFDFIKKYNWILLTFYFVFLILHPIRNMSFGDGLLLLETNLLETTIFSFQFTLDEIFETISHSLLLKILVSLGWDNDPRIVYGFLSSFAGIVLVFILLKEETEKKSLGLYFFLSAGGFLLFYGYSENYTLVSLIHFTLYFKILYWLRNESKNKNLLLYGATAFVSIAILFHLVSGYLSLLLFYLWYQHSPKHSKPKHLIVSTLLGLLIILPVFFYFIFLHNPSIDSNSTHLIHPPFYPKQRLVSINHFKEILSVLYFNTGIPILFLLYGYFFHHNSWRTFIQKEEYKILFVASFCFFLHGFFHNPQLGFPADWDLMGFYWIPITYLAYSFWNEMENKPKEFLPILFFGVSLTILSGMSLSKEDPNKEELWKLTKDLIVNYANDNSKFIASLDKKDKKFYTKGDFLFYKAAEITKRMCPFDLQGSIIERMENHRFYWNLAFKNGLFKDKNELQVFLTEATKTNVMYLKSLEVNKICHPKP